MPCRDDYPPEPTVLKTTHDATKAELKRAKERLDKYARMLCYLCGELDGVNSQHTASHFIERNPELAEWWANHKAADARRLAREEAERKAKQEIDRKVAEHEATRREALSKLSKKEREVLGLL